MRLSRGRRCHTPEITGRRHEDLVFAKLLIDLEVHVADEAPPRVRVRIEEAGPLTLFTDPDILLQILLNLVRNGLEASDDGTVAVTARSEGTRVHITIDDDGPGLPPGAQDRLFEPFFSTKSFGTGLGLPISQRLAEKLNGSIRLVPRSSGGTRARLILEGAVATNEAKAREDIGG